ncbi:MAG: OmpA family protein [Saprospiraceae bacterium]|nr:OmpA family protein [Saprospiraceae bacterium]
MKSLRIIILFLACSWTLAGQDVSSLISPFEGSTHLGDYESRFSSLTLLVSPLDSKKIPSQLAAEGGLTSTIYQRPENVSSFEVHASYRKVLEAANFDILLDCVTGDCNTKQSVQTTYGYPKKEMRNRKYNSVNESTIAYLVGWGNHYLSARKKTADNTYYAMIIISDQRQLYSVDVVKVQNMEEGTVTLAPELLEAKIASEGKAILHGLYFETGKDILTDASQPALNAIAIYLKKNSADAYYVVGHTDDTGNVDDNVSLSQNRAKAVIATLLKLDVPASQLAAYGVGPFSPSSTNRSDLGKSQNRRVELVLRIR